MKAQLWSLSGLSVELGMDRRSLERQIVELAPDKSEDKGSRTFNQYYMSRVVDHLLGNSGIDFTAERARLTKEQADKAEMENALRRGELISADKATKVWLAVIHTVKTKLLGLPSSMAPYLENKERADIESQLSDGIHDALRELANNPHGGLETSEEDDSKPVG